MKAKLYLIIASTLMPFFVLAQSNSFETSISSFHASSKAVTPAATDNWFADASSWIKQFEYDFHESGISGYKAINAANKTGYRITTDGYHAYPMRLTEDDPAWQVSFHLLSLGRDKAAYYFKQVPSTAVNNGVLVQHFGFADVEYRNDVNGLRQNFIVHQDPGGSGDLRIRISLKTDLKASLVNQQHLLLKDGKAANQTRLIYEDLRVWDARHQLLDAYMELDDNNQLSLVVDDRAAVYPITVDPLNKSPEWTTSADGLLPALLTNLQLQVQTLYGYTVTGLGDVNADGFDDVAVSAPTMANVVSGTGSLLGVGAVFVYFGSATGLPAQPNHVLQPTVTVGGGLFGLSVAAGDVTGNANPDIIVGAPLETVSLNFGALGGGVIDGKVGRVYLYNGANITGSLNPASTLSLTLSTAELTNTTISINSLLGFSVAATGDMDNDGKGEIIAGAPTYARVSGLVNVKTGGAFVYLSFSSGGAPFSSIVSLAPPTGSVLGLSGAVQTIIEALPGGGLLWATAGPVLTPVLNGQIEGLLFGYSVEGIGPYTSDAIADVAVGAPAGVNLGTLTSGLSLAGAVSSALSGQILGGSAYVFAGTGTNAGVSATAAARLQSNASGILASAANLFGYSMRGVKAVSGVKNGNVLISAPVSSVLSNVVGGLQVKSGIINVFSKQTGTITSPVAPIQQINSPRASSILSILNGQTLNVSLLYGASMDNLLDINCDNNADIIVGEPLTSNVPVLGANVVGGGAYVLLGRPDGTYQQTAVWNLTSVTSPLVGVNATALLGFSVAGAGRTNGAAQPIRSIVGGPANSLDFGVGLLNLGNTAGTLLSFAADNNGIGKAYLFNADLCGIAVLPATLISFKGDKIDNSTVGLEWATVDEHDLSHYEVERSTDGVNFIKLADVTAKEEQRNLYKYPDYRPVYGKNYYRLRVVDDNGKYVYSATVVVQFNQKLSGIMAAAPNPAYQQINLRLTGYQPGEYTLRLYNTAGILLETRKVNLREHQQTEVLNRSRSMSPGVYMVTLHDDSNHKLSTIRLIFNEQ